MSIPKIIHYCWFGGGEIPIDMQYCMKTWKKLEKSGYKFMKWDESNCNFDENEFVKKAYKEKRWGFIGDYYRLKVLYDYGGVYLDTDVYIHQNFDDILKNKAFIGFMTKNALCTAIVGAEKNSNYIKNLLTMYETGKFPCYDTIKNDMFIEPYRNNQWPVSNESWTWATKYYYPNFLFESKFQRLNDFVIFPKEYFEQGALLSKWYSIHLSGNTWKDKIYKRNYIKEVLKKNIYIRIIRRHIGLLKNNHNSFEKYNKEQREKNK